MLSILANFGMSTIICNKDLERYLTAGHMASHPAAQYEEFI